MAPAPPPLRREEDIIRDWGVFDRPLVSVLCATYNHVRYIPSALAGFFGQITRHPFEVVVRDDASDDGTSHILRDWAERYKRLLTVIIERENQWHKRNVWNRLVEASSGDVLMLCDGDDYWVDTCKIETQVDMLTADPTCSLVYHGVLDVENDTVAGTTRLRLPEMIPSERLMKGAYVPTSSCCFRRESVSEFRYHDRVLNFDTFLWAVLGKSGYAVNSHELHASVHRIHPDGVWSSIDDDRRNQEWLVTCYWAGLHFRECGYDEVALSYYQRGVNAMSSLGNGTAVAAEVFVHRRMLHSSLARRIEQRIVRNVRVFMAYIDAIMLRWGNGR